MKDVRKWIWGAVISAYVLILAIGIWDVGHRVSDGVAQQVRGLFINETHVRGWSIY